MKERIKKPIIPKKIKTEKDVIAYLQSLKCEFLQVMKTYENIEDTNCYTSREITDNKMTIEALENACEIIEYRVAKKSLRKGQDKCPTCKQDLQVTDKIIYCSGCGQKIITSKT